MCSYSPIGAVPSVPERPEWVHIPGEARHKAQQGDPVWTFRVLQERPDGRPWQQPEFLSLQQLFNSGRVYSEAFPCGIPISHESVPDSTSTSAPRKERARELQRKLFMEQEAAAFGHE